MTDYAGSNIKVSTDKVIRPGETVTQKDLNCTDEEYEQYKRDGVVRSDKLPDDMLNDETLQQYRVRKATQEYEDAMAAAIEVSPPAGVSPGTPEAGKK